MSSRDDFDVELEERFNKLRIGDAQSAPDFGRMLASARTEAAAIPDVTGEGVDRSTPGRWRRFRVVAVAGPLLAAAGLGAVWFSPGRRAEREFDRVVHAWAATSQQTFHSPTDGLLAVPGSEYLRSVPAIGRGLGDFRRGS